MFFHVPLSHSINLDWIFSSRFALAVTQKHQSPLKRCEEREETGFFSAFCLYILADCRLASRTWHCLYVWEREPPPPLQITWNSSVGTKWLWGDIRNWNVWVRGALLAAIFSLSQCAEAKKKRPFSRQLDFKWNTADESPHQEGVCGTMLGFVPQTLFADVFGELCPAVVGRCGKNTDASVWYGVKMLSEFWGQCCQNKCWWTWLKISCKGSRWRR